MAQQLDGAGLVEMNREKTHTCHMGNHPAPPDRSYGCGTCPACELRRL
ncbi:MAG: 7-cyano-7-deazaguanine synthase [Betaproteobacteria bacterium]|nr:7-cyano-7-deazaguanine synthase [Betaproteobacteria bacterium]